MPDTLPTADTERDARPARVSPSCESDAPSKVPTAHAGRASTCRNAVAVSVFVVFPETTLRVKVTRKSPLFVEAPLMVPVAASNLSPDGSPFAVQPAAPGISSAPETPAPKVS